MIQNNAKSTKSTLVLPVIQQKEVVPMAFGQRTGDAKLLCALQVTEASKVRGQGCCSYFSNVTAPLLVSRSKFTT